MSTKKQPKIANCQNPACNVEFNPAYSKQKFCCRSCAAKLNNKNRPPRSLESRQKTSISTRNTKSLSNFKYTNIYYRDCIQCDRLFVTKTKRSNHCSKTCVNKTISTKASERLRNSDYRKNYGRGKKSYLEQSFEKWLLDYNFINYETEVHFYNEKLKKNYYVDFLFRDKNLIIELDGSQHRYTVEKDKIRDNYLTSLGYTVIRITHKDYQKQTYVQKLISLL